MINYDMTHYGMWSARVKNGKSTSPQATPPVFVKYIYFSTLKDILYTVRMHTIVL